MFLCQIYKYTTTTKLKIKHIKTSAAASYKVYKVTEAATKNSNTKMRKGGKYILYTSIST